MDAILVLLEKTLSQVWLAFVHNWPFLLVSVLVAVALKLFVPTEKLTAALLRHQKTGVLGATLAAVLTPFCSCGTTAVILGMMASTIPWAPIVAFMVASPLSSPEELIYSAGLFGWPFAISFFAASIFLGLFSGIVTAWFGAKGWLKNQSRFEKPVPQIASFPISQFQPRSYRQTASPNKRIFSIVAVSPAVTNCCSALASSSATPACSCGSSGSSISLSSSSSLQPADQPVTHPLSFAAILQQMWTIGSRLLWMFALFAFIGYLLNNLIPTSWMTAIFGSHRVYSVPLAATLGLPLYINSEASLPLIRAMIDNGMNQGAALAFLISGAGTSIGAISGALTIARWRIIALVVGILWVGAMLAGATFNLLFPLGLI